MKENSLESSDKLFIFFIEKRCSAYTRLFKLTYASDHFQQALSSTGVKYLYRKLDIYPKIVCITTTKGWMVSFLHISICVKHLLLMIITRLFTDTFVII